LKGSKDQPSSPQVEPAPSPSLSSIATSCIYIRCIPWYPLDLDQSTTCSCCASHRRAKAIHDR
jgi:hypothetical protein